jgi:hypothetical protein
MTELYFVKVRCNNVTFNALIDSGAQMSIISPSMLQKLKIDTHLHTIGYVHGIGKDKMMGHCSCKLRLLGNKHVLPVDVTFTIVLHTNLTILGLDFLEKYECMIDCYHKVLHLQQYRIPLMNKHERIVTKLNKKNAK